MSAEIIVLPARTTLRPRSTKHALDDLRHNTFEAQPPARTKSGEMWHVNGYNMSQVIIIRDNGYQVIADFHTARDAAAAAQAHNILVRIKAGEPLAGILGDYAL